MSKGMSPADPSDSEIRELLSKYKTIAVVGCSRNPGKDAHRIPSYMNQHGYRIIPVNPFAEEILGEKSYGSLLDIPEEVRVKFVNIFRPSRDVPPIVNQAIERGSEVIWMQLGIQNEEAASEARMAGLVVVQNRCLTIEHQRLLT
ncbi:MAG: CoA-binding protein [Candidatus Geothermarchaeales archaeon]